MSILNFAPENHFYDRIRNGPKIGTIRDKPKKVGETLHLWEKKRGMRKGYYCPACLCSQHVAHSNCRNPDMILLPRKIAEKKCTACTEIFMKLQDGHLEIVGVNKNGWFYTIAIICAGYKKLHPFARGEGFNSNREMVEWFRKYLKEGIWSKKYWIRWD